MRIDINRLRRLVTDKDALGAGKREIGDRIREAGRDIQRLERDLDSAQASPVVDERGLKRATDALAAARAAKSGLAASQQDLAERFHLAATLASRGIAMAKHLGVCPADLIGDY